MSQITTQNDDNRSVATSDFVQQLMITSLEVFLQGIKLNYLLFWALGRNSPVFMGTAFSI
jgi:hypothetical protein